MLMDNFVFSGSGVFWFGNQLGDSFGLMMQNRGSKPIIFP